jgi:hypothetical protein
MPVTTAALNPPERPNSDGTIEGSSGIIRIQLRPGLKSILSVTAYFPLDFSARMPYLFLLAQELRKRVRGQVARPGDRPLRRA